MAPKHFFEEQKDQSLVKTTIVDKYFDAWTNVIIRTQKKYPQYSQKIAYIDLFAGPGRYKDGSKSTPLKILTKATENKDLCERLVTIFNDKDDGHARSLEKSVSEIPGIEKLRFEPAIYNEEVGEQIVKIFESMSLVPTLFFIDPFGYKGLSLRLVNSVLRNWGSDAILFFNYNRINMGINNEFVKEPIQALFGNQETFKLKTNLHGRSPQEREMLIIEELCQALKAYSYRYVLPFRFKNERGKRTSHHLIFVSKHFLGYEIMKDIMAGESTSNNQGVYSFEYNPADFLPRQTLLFHLSRPLDELKSELLKTFKGRKLKMIEIYREHNVDTPYIKKNYKETLISLYNEGLIEAVSEKGAPPRKGTFGDNIIATFPR